MNDSDLVDILNDLYETSQDGVYGFRQCAEHVKSPALKTTLAARAQECEAGARELAEAIARRGGKLDEGGSASGALHRGWVSVRAVLSTATDTAMLEECERGEDHALEAYRKARAEDLPPDLRLIVDRQYEGVKRNHDQIRELRNRARAAS